MHHANSILSMLHGPFLMEGAALQAFQLQVIQVLTGKVKAEDLVDKAQAAARMPYYALTPHAAAVGVQGYQSLNDVPAGSVAVHQVSGVMMPEDSWFGPGTKSIGRGVLAADQHENIVGHVGMFRTPGGSTTGLEDFAGTIAGTQKPFVAYVEQGCSAGYWSASGADCIVLAGRTAMLGSIGTKAEFLDFSGFYKQMGIEQVSVNATKSVNKNKSFDDAIAGNYAPLRAEILDPLNEVFLDTVLQNRAGKIDPKDQKAVLSGLVFVGEANLANGLADALGSFDDAVQLAQDLAAAGYTPPAPSSSTNSKMGLFDNKKTFGAAMLALQGAETVTPEMATAANAELNAMGIAGAALVTPAAHTALEAKADRADSAEASLKTMTDALAAAGVADIGALVAARTTAEASLKTMTDALATAGATDVMALAASRDEWKGKAEAYGSQAGEMGTTSEKKKADVSEEGGDENQKTVDALHAKMLGE